MMKFRRSRSSGSYSVSRPGIRNCGEVAYPDGPASSSGDDTDKGRYTLVDKETLSLPNTPRSSFRQSVRKSLRKLKRKKKQKLKTNESDFKYDIKVQIKETEEEDIYDTVQIDDIIENKTDSCENDVIVKEYASRKPSFLTEDSKENNVYDVFSGKSNQDIGYKEIDSIIRDKESKLYPRGPLGDLLKQKEALKSEELNDQEFTNDIDLETDDKKDEVETEKADPKITDKEAEIEDVSSNESIQIGTETAAKKTFLLDKGSEVDRCLTPAIVSHSRKPINSSELQLIQGDIVFLHRRMNNDWYLGEKRGVFGLIPASYIQILVDSSHAGIEMQVRAVASKNYQGRNDKELNMTKGQLVYLTNRLDYHWYVGQVQGGGGRIGLIPAAYLDIIAADGVGSLPLVPDWAIKRTVTMDVGEDKVKDDDEEDLARSRRGRWLTKKQKESTNSNSSRKAILDNLSKRKDLELFV